MICDRNSPIIIIIFFFVHWLIETPTWKHIIFVLYIHSNVTHAYFNLQCVFCSKFFAPFGSTIQSSVFSIIFFLLPQLDSYLIFFSSNHTPHTLLHALTSFSVLWISIHCFCRQMKTTATTTKTTSKNPIQLETWIGLACVF